MDYTAKEAAQKLGITKDTLLYYEKEGLLPPIKRDQSNRRVYSESDIEWVFLIRCLRDTDMSICKIKQYIALLKKNPENSMQERRRILAEHAVSLKERIKIYQNFLRLMEKKIDYYDKALSSEHPEQIACMDYAEEWRQFRMLLGGIEHD